MGYGLSRPGILRSLLLLLLLRREEFNPTLLLLHIVIGTTPDEAVIGLVRMYSLPCVAVVCFFGRLHPYNAGAEDVRVSSPRQGEKGYCLLVVWVTWCGNSRIVP